MPQPLSASANSPTATTSEGDVEANFAAKPEELADQPLDREVVHKYLEEISRQPNWRAEADLACEFYDGNQLDAETIEILKDRGQPPLITNLISAAVNTVLGIEVGMRQDWRVRQEDDEVASADAADALSLKLKHAETKSGADRACSDAFAAQVKAGIGFIEVARESDPFKPPYRVRYIHRREIYWDWKSQERDLSDARYLIRRRWVEVDTAIAMMPQYADLFRGTCSNWNAFDPLNEKNWNLAQSMDLERDTKWDASTWRDTERRTVCLHEIWYRKWVTADVMIFADGKATKIDYDNEAHQDIILSGVVRVKKATFQVVRLAWYCGPHFLYDEPSPYTHTHFPYVPFFGYREDITGAPYGLVRAMISPQKEVNARKSKVLWNLNSRRVIADQDAVTDHDTTRDEVARADAYLILNPNRRSHSRFEVDSGGELSSMQFQVMQESKQEIAEASGIHKSMQGQQSGATSGLAINSLVQQGMTTIAGLNDNFQHGRRLVGEQLFSLMVQDYSGRQITVKIGEGMSQRVIVLNELVMDEVSGQTTIKNNVATMDAAVVLGDVGTTPTFRMQQLQSITQVMQSLPPEAQTAMLDFLVEATDLPGATRIADRLRQMLRLPDDSPEARQAQKQQQDEQANIQREMASLDMEERRARIAGLQAKAAEADSPDNTDQAQLAELQQLREENARLAQLVANKTHEVDVRARTELQKARIASATQLEIAAQSEYDASMHGIMAEIKRLNDRMDLIGKNRNEAGNG